MGATIEAAGGGVGGVVIAFTEVPGPCESPQKTTQNILAFSFITAGTACLCLLFTSRILDNKAH
jgi:hypothetical protein